MTDPRHPLPFVLGADGQCHCADCFAARVEQARDERDKSDGVWARVVDVYQHFRRKPPPRPRDP